MQHDWNKYFDTETDYWKKIQKIYQENEEYPKVIVSGRNLHHKFMRSFSKKENEPVDNDSENLVSLDLADHYLVHYYLWKCTKKGWRTFTARAFTMMNKTAQKYITDETVELLAQEYKKALKDIKVSKETKRKLSEVKKNQSAETRKKISERLKGHKGIKHNDETKKKIAEANKHRVYKNNLNKYWNFYVSESIKLLGIKKHRHFSEETRRKMAEAKKGKPNPHKGNNKGKHWKLVDGKRVYY